MPERVLNLKVMIKFESDYLEGCHPRILERLMKTNLEQTPGYGEDEICTGARETVRKACCAPDADIHFLVGGTQTNATVISSVLRPYQGVLCAQSGHINVHETGAIEHTAHKVLPLPSSDGKITASQIEQAVEEHFGDASAEHTVQPGMVYISFPTELGTIYSKSELEALSGTCRKYGIPLFIDGARLGYGLASSACDLELKDIAALADIFYIGGTKQGALFGEAVVICNDSLKKDFRYNIKQNGGMLAKGRLLGIQFDELLKDSLYFDLSRKADLQAERLKAAFRKKGYKFLIDSPTNQIFPILPFEVQKTLSKDFGFEQWGKIDATSSAVRFCTSWATPDSNIDALIKSI